MTKNLNRSMERAAQALTSLGIDPTATDREIQRALEFSTSNSTNYRTLLGQSHKCDMGEGQGWKTKVQYLSPARDAGIVGFTACPWASPGCAPGCIKTSGMMPYPTHIKVRQRRTLRWFLYPERTAEWLNLEISNHSKAAPLDGYGAAVRLDGTSEQHFWRNPHVDRTTSVKLYDYLKSGLTKTALRAHRSGWHLTFSLSEKPASLLMSEAWAEHGVNTAIVVGGPVGTSRKKNKLLAEALTERGEFFGRQVIFGDSHDLRFLDPAAGGWLALGAKGQSRHDETGFVVRFDLDKLLGTDAPAEDCLLPAHAERFFNHHNVAATAAK